MFQITHFCTNHVQIYIPVWSEICLSTRVVHQESEERTMCRSLQTSLSFGIAVRAQYKLLTVHGAVLFFPQRLQFTILVAQSLLLLPFNMSFEKSKSPNTKEEGDRPQTKCEAQVHYPVLNTILLEDRLLRSLWCMSKSGSKSLRGK